jgi:Rrf2 family protein
MGTEHFRSPGPGGKLELHWPRMAANTRLSVAAHVLLALGHREGGAYTSEELARSVRTNPVVLRRLLGKLSTAGLVDAHPGPTGGYALARPLERVTLLDVWRAVDDASLFGLHATPVNRACPVSRGVRDALSSAYERADRAVEASLGRTTLASLLEEIEKAD